MNRDWKIEYKIPEIPPELLNAGFTPLLASVLAVKGIRTVKEADQEFFCGSDSILDPMLMKGMGEAVERIKRAIVSKEKVAVYGDYDVDGITSTCLLTDYLQTKGLEVIPYIPDRTEEGYGLNCGALNMFSEEGVSLVITVDCGITATDEAIYAKGLGIDMIITDHHECKSGEIPEACAVIDCKQTGDTYPNQNLAGVGVAFKLASACEGDLQEMLSRYSDLVAIGTVADVMPLLEENRYFVIHGIERIRNNPRPGLKAMLKEAGVEPETISASSIGYSLAPRLNAAGRLGQAISAGELIMSTSTEKASALAAELCELNRKRQVIEGEIWKEAAGMVGLTPPDHPIVLASDKWHQGVIGIAASRLAEYYSVPTIMINLNGDVGKGSCRSFGGFNLFEALSACSEHLISFGGHALAAGLNIMAERIDSFREALYEYYRANRPEPQPEITCDLLITDASILDIENVRSLDRLEPFGNGNPKPVMCMQSVRLEKAQNVGNGRHLKLRIDASGYKFDCIFFGHTLQEQGIGRADTIDIAFTPTVNEYHGMTSIQLQLYAVRPHSPDTLCTDILENGCSFPQAAAQYAPVRSDFIRAWKSLGINFRIGSTEEAVLDRCPYDLAPETYCICLEVFREAGLFAGDRIYGAVPADVEEKADLESTKLMQRLRNLK